MDALGQPMLEHEITRKFIIAAAGNHEFNFILAIKRIQIFHTECIRLARIGALYIHNFDHSSRQIRDGTLAAGFDEHGVTMVQ